MRSAQPSFCAAWVRIPPRPLFEIFFDFAKFVLRTCVIREIEMRMRLEIMKTSKKERANSYHYKVATGPAVSTRSLCAPLSLLAQSS